MNTLAPYAVQEHNSHGRQITEHAPEEYRSNFQRDRDRLIHCAAFRRLEYKTQVFVNHEGDLFRTRLTHTLEVAQISRTIARALQLNEDLTEAIALAHDLGHTPFGHAGQDALNACMKNYGGFEHNWQALRIVDELEERYPDFRGLNLLFETREGILKHCSPKTAKQLGKVGERFLNEEQAGQPSLEAQLVNLSDSIAYNTHDIDDGLRAKLISLRQLREYRLFNEPYEEISRKYPSLGQRRVIHETIRRMVGAHVSNVIETSHATLDALQPTTLDEIRRADEEMINLSAMMYEKHLELKRFLQVNMYQHYRVRRMAYKAKQIIQRLFEAFMNDPYLLPIEAQMEVQRLQTSLGGDTGRARAIADYLASMTDRFAIQEYEKLFNPTTLP